MINLNRLKFEIWFNNPSLFFRDVFGEEPYPYQSRVLIEVRDIIMKQRKNIRILLMAAGGCILEGSVIHMADGSFKKVEDIKPNDTVLSFNGSIIEQNTVHKLIDSGIKEVYELKNKVGTKLYATNDHPIYTSEGWKYVKDFYKRNKGSFESNTKALFLESYNVPDYPISDEEIILLSALISEGHYGAKQSPKVTNNNVSYLNMLEEIGIERFNLVPKYVKKNNGYDLILSRNRSCKSRSPLIEWLRNIGIYGQVKENKRIPPFVFKLSNRQIQLFLKTFYKGDCSKETIKRTDKKRFILYQGLSNALATDLSMLLRRIGIYPKIRKRIGTNSKAPSFKVVFYAHDNIFDKKIPTTLIETPFWIERSLGKKQVYDIQMNNYSNFITEGLVVHNTGKTKLLSAISLFITVVIAKKLNDPYSTIIISGSRDQAKNLYEFAKVAFKDNEMLSEQVDGEPLQHETKLLDRSLIKAVSKSLKAIQGQHHDVVIIDEAPLAGDFIIRDTLRIIAQSDKDIIILSRTPINQEMANEPIGELFVEYWEDEDKYPEWKRYHWSSRDCPNIGTAKYIEAQKNLPEDMFEVFWEGKPHASSSRIYVIDHTKLKIATKGIPISQYNPNEGIVIAGLDWGFGTSLTVLIIVQYIKTEDGLMRKVLYTQHWKTEELVTVHKQIAEICKKYNVRIVYADGAQKGENERLSNRGLYVEPITFNQNKLEMQTRMRIIFHQEAIQIPEEYQDLIQNLRKFTWAKKSGQDYSDAMCLALYREEDEDINYYYEIY